MPNRESKSGMQGVHMGNLTLSGTTPASTAWFDTLGFDAVTLFMLNNTVTDAGTASGFSVVIQESDSTAAASATTVAAKDLQGAASDLTVTLDTADDVLAGGIGYKGSKRYVRATVTGTTGTDADVTFLGVGTMAAREPTTFIGTKVAAT